MGRPQSTTVVGRPVGLFVVTLGGVPGLVLGFGVTLSLLVFGTIKVTDLLVVGLPPLALGIVVGGVLLFSLTCCEVDVGPEVVAFVGTFRRVEVSWGAIQPPARPPFLGGQMWRFSSVVRGSGFLKGMRLVNISVAAARALQAHPRYSRIDH